MLGRFLEEARRNNRWVSAGEHDLEVLQFALFRKITKCLNEAKREGARYIGLETRLIREFLHFLWGGLFTKNTIS